MGDLIATALASFALTWLLSFWHRTEPLRERLGVMVVIQEGRRERVDAGGLGAWLNCPQCAALLTLPLAWPLRKVLSPLGLALLLVRWWESQRPKAEWWT